MSQHATDILLNEIERRGELKVHDGMPIVPYEPDYSVETILTLCRTNSPKVAAVYGPK